MLFRSAASGASATISVTGLNPGASATITVATSRTGYANGSAQVTGTAQTGAALTPSYGAVTRTADGFTSTISNYSALYTFTGTTTAGSVSVNNSNGAISVTGLAANTSATVTITATRTGYATGSSSVTASASIGAALNPSFATATPTSDGYTVQVSNYDANYTFAVSASSGSATISNTGLVTEIGKSTRLNSSHSQQSRMPSSA